MALVFAVVSVLVWLVLFDTAREAVFDRAGRIAAALGSVLSRWQDGASSRAQDSSQAVRAASGRVAGKVSRHRWLLIASLLLVLVPPLLTLALRQRVALGSVDDAPMLASNPQILELLRGERLVPPPELPPEVFIAAEAEVEAVQQRTGEVVIAPEKIASADRRWNNIDPDFQQRVLAIYQVMRQHGYEMVLVEGYRSPERQARLAAGGKATRAGAGQSCHQYGLAVDSAPMRDGKLQWNMEDPWTRRGYFLYGELAQQAGLEWGGNWRSIKDYVHLEMKDACRSARRAAGR
ncbi:M15 family peptidase [Lysobacter psychrotolerans]|uniref:M15 family peptidase n=2 Tax=Montanilutibacter psychrotolerans TaxID=1327343 RepID=A0A3M8ST69_9GAMM|nr:M15 family peptidase [Lysobacter psychrotolerans]